MASDVRRRMGTIGYVLKRYALSINASTVQAYRTPTLIACDANVAYRYCILQLFLQKLVCPCSEYKYFMQRRKTVTMTSLVGHFVRSCAQSNGQLTKLVGHCPMTGWRYNPCTHICMWYLPSSYLLICCAMSLALNTLHLHL